MNPARAWTCTILAQIPADGTLSSAAEASSWLQALGDITHGQLGSPQKQRRQPNKLHVVFGGGKLVKLISGACH